MSKRFAYISMSLSAAALIVAGGQAAGQSPLKPAGAARGISIQERKGAVDAAVEPAAADEESASAPDLRKGLEARGMSPRGARPAAKGDEQGIIIVGGKRMTFEQAKARGVDATGAAEKGIIIVDSKPVPLAEAKRRGIIIVDAEPGGE